MLVEEAGKVHAACRALRLGLPGFVQVVTYDIKYTAWHPLVRPLSVPLMRVR